MAFQHQGILRGGPPRPLVGRLEHPHRQAVQGSADTLTDGVHYAGAVLVRSLRRIDRRAGPGPAA